MIRNSNKRFEAIFDTFFLFHLFSPPPLPERVQLFWFMGVIVGHYLYQQFRLASIYIRWIESSIFLAVHRTSFLLFFFKLCKRKNRLTRMTFKKIHVKWIDSTQLLIYLFSLTGGLESLSRDAISWSIFSLIRKRPWRQTQIYRTIDVIPFLAKNVYN